MPGIKSDEKTNLFSHSNSIVFVKYSNKIVILPELFGQAT